MTSSLATRSYMPNLGEYVVLQLDPAATLASLEDETATSAAKQISTKKYVGYCSEGFDLPNPERLFHQCNFRLISHGLPRDDPADGIEKSMCVPVMPNTEHPDGRPPIPLNKALPWSDCYHYSSIEVVLRVPSVWKESAMVTEIEPFRAMGAHRRQIEADTQQRNTLLSPCLGAPSVALDSVPGIEGLPGTTHGQSTDAPASYVPHPEHASDVPPTAAHIHADLVSNPSARTDVPIHSGSGEVLNTLVPGSGPSSESLNSVCHARPDSETPAPDGDLDPIDDDTYFMALMMLALLTTPGGPETMPIANVEYDLSTLEDFNDPRELFKEIAAIKAIEDKFKADSEARLAALDKEYDERTHAAKAEYDAERPRPESNTGAPVEQDTPHPKKRVEMVRARLQRVVTTLKTKLRRIGRFLCT